MSFCGYPDDSRVYPPDPFANRFNTLRLVGRGGFGAVYRAWDTELEREVALKLLNANLASDPDFRKRFKQEATAASKLNHPNITIVYDRGEYQGQPFIVMELVEGEPLSKIIERRTALTDPERLFLIEQLCDGLHYAHQRNIVHRDVKPVNLVVREEHDGTDMVRTLKILDFGIAKIVSAGQSSTGQLMFTPNYVSPEQIRGSEVDRRSDIFAVGAVVYELLVSEKAFVIRTSNPFALLEEVKLTIAERPHRPMTERAARCGPRARRHRRPRPRENPGGSLQRPRRDAQPRPGGPRAHARRGERTSHHPHRTEAAGGNQAGAGVVEGGQSDRRRGTPGAGAGVGARQGSASVHRAGARGGT